MNNLIKYIIKDYTSVLETVSSACRNYSYHLTQGDYVRHPSYPQTLVRPYAVTIKDTRLPVSFFRSTGFLFSSEVLL